MPGRSPEVEELDKLNLIHGYLSARNGELYKSLPKNIALQLSLDRDSHGNVQVSLIETESLLSAMVEKRLEEMAEDGEYVGKFSAQHHFFGYEGRCADPTNFDADYTYAPDTMQPCSSTPASPATCQACVISPTIQKTGFQAEFQSP